MSDARRAMRAARADDSGEMAQRPRKLAAFLVRGALARHSLSNESAAFPESFAVTRLRDAVQWARKYSLFS